MYIKYKYHLWVAGTLKQITMPSQSQSQSSSLQLLLVSFDKPGQAAVVCVSVSPSLCVSNLEVCILSKIWLNKFMMRHFFVNFLSLYCAPLNSRCCCDTPPYSKWMLPFFLRREVKKASQPTTINYLVYVVEIYSSDFFNAFHIFLFAVNFAWKIFPIFRTAHTHTHWKLLIKWKWANKSISINLPFFAGLFIFICTCGRANVFI